MGFLERYPTERNGEIPEEMKGTVHDNELASGGTTLQTEYKPSCAL